MNKTLLIILGVIVVGALLLFFTRQAPVAPPPANVTVENITESSFGDMVTIDFVLTLEDGTVVDTNNPELAKEYGVMNYVKGPYTFILGQSGKVPGFDDALTGMKEGEHRESIIEPSEPEVKLVVNKTRILERFITINKKQPFPLKAFETHFKKQPIIGDVVFSETFAFKYQVLNITNTSVIAEMIVKEGETYTLENTEWESKVAKVANDDVMFYQMPEENQTLQTPFGSATVNLSKSRIYLTFEPELNRVFNKSIELGGGFTIPQAFQVVEIHDDYFIIKRYGLLTDKSLKLVADMRAITKGVKEVRQDKPLITEVVGGIEN